MREIKRFQTWQSETGRIKNRFFLKTELLFGSSKEADFRDKDLAPIEARLDLSKNELYFIETGEKQAVGERDLFQVGDQIYRWQSLEAPDSLKKWFVSIGLSFIGLLFLVFTFLPTEGSIECRTIETKIYSGRWSSRGLTNQEDTRLLKNLQQWRSEFRDHLRLDQLISAKSILNSMENEIKDNHLKEECGVLYPLFSLEEKLTKKIIKKQLSENQLVLAARIYREFREKVGQDLLQGVDRKLVYYARKRYRHGYRLKDLDPNRAFEAMEEARQVCRLLGQEESCFRRTRQN